MYESPGTETDDRTAYRVGKLRAVQAPAMDLLPTVTLEVRGQWRQVKLDTGAHVDELVVEHDTMDFLIGEDWMYDRGVKIDFVSGEMKRYHDDNKLVVPFMGVRTAAQRTTRMAKVWLLRRAKVRTQTVRNVDVSVPAEDGAVGFLHTLFSMGKASTCTTTHATKTSELVASFRNIVCVLEHQLRASTRQANRRVDSCQQLVDHLRRMVDQRDKDLQRMSKVVAERDIASSALQGVASSYFEHVPEAAAVISPGGADCALRFANQTIVYQRRVIQRQKNVLRRNGRISVTDPALALAAATDAPGLSPGDLALNARLCRLLEARWPELSQAQPGKVREITLRVIGPVATSSAPVSLPLSSAAPTSNSSAAALALTTADFNVPSTEPRRVPGSPFHRDHLTPETRPRQVNEQSSSGCQAQQGNQVSDQDDRVTAKPGKTAKPAAPTPPASGQSASTLGTAAVSAPTSPASSGKVSNSTGGATSLPDVLRLPIVTLRTRAAQAVSSDSRVPAQMTIWRDPPFFHLGSARCWDRIMGSCVVEIQKETVDGKPRVRSTPSALSGLAAFADVYAAQHPSQRRALFPDGPLFMSADALRRVRARQTSPKSAPHVEIVAEYWFKCRGDRQRNDQAGTGVQLWQKYSHERKRRSDALRSVLTELYGTLYKAVTEFDAASNTPEPQLDSELYFDPSVPFEPPANLPWFPTSADWCKSALDIDVGDPWRAWWFRMPELHPYNVDFRPRHPKFPVFGSAESDLSQVQSLVDEDVVLAESAPPTCSPSAPTPPNREGLDIFGSSEGSPDVTL
ncbi:unnamed protein product [Phytophthora fragariaefolia]|uniref:Unnamed protein product n=1 Tax=Phytophthora fragariaefolia TaxID=1490495 RepID=A0A9W6X366_9STRA|nr:unnamed protein product [Phytophthora fragariaefolia]